MKVTFMHLCDYAIVANDGKLSVLGIFDRINAAVFPWPHPTLFFAFQLQSDPSERGREFSVNVQCIDQDGSKLLEGDFPVRTESSGQPWEYQVHNQIVALHGLPFPRPGTYEFIISGAELGEPKGTPARLRFEVLAAKEHGV